MLGMLNKFPLVKCKKDDFILKVKCGEWLNEWQTTSHMDLSKNLKKKSKNREK